MNGYGAIMGFAMFVGALVPTYLVRLLFIWLTKRWDGGLARMLICNFLSLLVATGAGGVGMADGGPYQWGTAFFTYAIPQACWVFYDIGRARAHSDAKEWIRSDRHKE